MSDTEHTYTLTEARRELAIRECGARGHDWEFAPRRMVDAAPTAILCARCGWKGAVTMGVNPASVQETPA